VYISHPNKSEREEILKIHMKYMPIADSAFETVVSALCGMTFDDISALAEKLKGRTLTAKQVISAAKKYGRAEGRTAYDTRKIIVPAFENFGVSVKDPVRDELISEIAENTEGFVGSDLEGLCRESAMLAMRRNSESVSASDFKEAGRNIHPTMNPSVLEYYERINRSFKGGLSKEVQNLMEYQ
ncbi:MAG TPA: ATPase, partial [Methanocorpusculum sp.]|nr:ATPase [Methanocorpusculum sp.]